MNIRHLSKMAAILPMVVLSGCEPESPPIQRTVAVPAPVAAVPAAPQPEPAVVAPAAQVAVPVSREMQLAEASRCLTCHAIDRKLVGPAWKDIAAKYRGQKGAEAQLIEKVSKGGSGAWGATPMPPNAQVRPEDVRTLVRYILNLK